MTNPTKVRQKMELIVNIPDDIAKGIRGENECEVEPREIVRSFQATVAEAIANGIPYNPSGDCISREALKEDLAKEIKTNDMGLWLKILLVIDNAQTVPLPNEQIAWEQGYEAGLAQGKQDRPKGEWIDEGQYAEGHSEHAYICKECGYQIVEKPSMIFENRFCKYCGADMRGGAE